MNKYFSAAICCGLLLSTGKSYSAGTELLDQLSREKIIGNDSTNPFIAPEVTTSQSKISSSVAAAVQQNAKPARASETPSQKAAAKDAQRYAAAQEKLTLLSHALNKANTKINALSQELADVQNQKAALEKAAAAAQSTAALNDKMQAMKEKISDTSAQKLALESLFATLKTANSDVAQKNAELSAQLNQSMAQSEALNKQLAELQTQKKTLEAQLTALESTITGDKQKSSELIGQLNQSVARSDELSKQLATLQEQKKTLDEQLTALKAVDEKSTTLTKQLAEMQSQKKVLETELTALKETREKNAVLTKELAELQTQRRALDAQLATLKANGEKSTGEGKEVDTLKAQLSVLNLQKATLETRLAEQEKLFTSEKTKSDIVLKQFEDAKKVIASQESLLSLQKNNTSIEKEKSSAQLANAGKETTDLKKQLAELQTQNASLEEKQKTQSSSLAALTAENLKLKETQATAEKDVTHTSLVKIDKAASKDMKTSYAIGAWYGDAADREKIKLDGLNKKLDLKAFMQGFNDRVNNKLQLEQATLSKELTALDLLQKKQFTAAQSENEKQSKAIMTKAASEKGAKRLPDGAVYRVIKQGEAPLVNDQNEIMTEIDEVLGTGKVMSKNEIRASRVKDLPPLFQTVIKKLGLGGEAKLHIPAKQAYGESGVPGFVPPGTVSIITIKVVGIK